MKEGTWTQRPDGTIELKESKSSEGGQIYGCPHDPKTSAITWGVIILIIALIWGFIQLYKIAHSPKSIDVDLIGISTEHIPSKSPYSDGTRYVYLEFEVG